jgi:hypothetical protein
MLRLRLRLRLPPLITITTSAWQAAAAIQQLTVAAFERYNSNITPPFPWLMYLVVFAAGLITCQPGLTAGWCCACWQTQLVLLVSGTADVPGCKAY